MAISNTTNPPLTSRQRRVLDGVRGIMGEGAGVRAVVVGRANARWSVGARWTVGLFSAAFLLAFVYLHVILFPGALVLLVLYDTAKPKRGVAVTAAGISELRLSVVNGQPTSVIAATDHAAVFAPRLVQSNDGKSAVGFGTEVVSVRGSDLPRLQDAAIAAAAPITQPSLPPPPMLEAPPSHVAGSIPRWRQPTLLRVVGHFTVGLAFFVAILALSNAVASAFGRNTAHTADSAYNYLWGVMAAAIAGWMLFVYQRGSFRTRVILLSASAGGALLLACIVNIAYSPAR